MSLKMVSGSRAGAISKGDLKSFLAWAAEHLGYTELAAIGEATPTAEPLREGMAPQAVEQARLPPMQSSDRHPSVNGDILGRQEPS